MSKGLTAPFVLSLMEMASCWSPGAISLKSIKGGMTNGKLPTGEHNPGLVVCIWAGRIVNELSILGRKPWYWAFLNVLGHTQVLFLLTPGSTVMDWCKRYCLLWQIDMWHEATKLGWFLHLPVYTCFLVTESSLGGLKNSPRLLWQLVLKGYISCCPVAKQCAVFPALHSSAMLSKLVRWQTLGVLWMWLSNLTPSHGCWPSRASIAGGPQKWNRRLDLDSVWPRHSEIKKNRSGSADETSCLGGGLIHFGLHSKRCVAIEVPWTQHLRKPCFGTRHCSICMILRVGASKFALQAPQLPHHRPGPALHVSETNCSPWGADEDWREWTCVERKGAHSPRQPHVR